MKNIIFTVFFTLILAGFPAFGQTRQLIKQVDTLQNGSVMITLMLQDSTYLKQYFAISAVDTALLFNNILTSLPQSDQSNPDYQIDNDNLFGENTSALPWDICFNPVQNKYYIYNYRKIMIRNNSGAGYFDTPVIISDFDEINENLLESAPSKRMLYYNNYLYCTSNEGKLVIINCSNNQIVTEYAANQMSSVYKSDLRLVGSNVFWYYCAINELGFSGTSIKKVSGTNLGASLNLTNIIVNDWCYDEYNNMYLATNNGLFTYSSDLELINSNLQYQNMTNIEYFDNGTIKRIVTRSYHPGNYELLSFTTNLILNQTFNTTCDKFFNMKFGAYNNTIHYTGIQGNHLWYYGKILFNSSTNEFYEDPQSIKDFDAPIALEINSTDAYIGDKDKIHKIDQNNIQTDYEINGYCTRLIMDNSLEFKLSGTISLSGDFFVFDDLMQKTAFETGGIVNGVCQKMEKIYYAVNKGNGGGYVLCKNKNSIIHILSDLDYFDPKAIFCFNEDEQTDVLVVFEGRDSFDEKRLKFAKIDFNTSELSILESLDFPFEDNITEFVIKHFNERIYFTEVFRNVCFIVPLVYFHFTPSGTLCYNSTWINSCPDIEYDPVSDRLYLLDKCFKKLYTYNADDLTLIHYEDLVKEAYFHPISLCFNSTGNRLLISGIDFQNDNNIRLLECNPNHDPFVLNTYPLNSSGIKVTDLTLSKDNNVYGFSGKYCYKINPAFNITQFTLPEVLESYDVDFDFQENLFYIESINNTANGVVTFVFDANNSTFLEPINSSNQYLVNTINEQNLSYYNADREVIYHANHAMANAYNITCPFSRPLLTPWHWLSFPRLQRTGNDPVTAIPVLENTEPMPYNLSFYSNEGGVQQVIIRQNNRWQPLPFNEITSTRGYKLNIIDQGTFTHTMYGSDLNPNTPVSLYLSQNGNPENWIGYFLHQPLMPQVAFQGVWDNLTQIKTQDWTMTKVILNGKPVWISPSNVGPLKYGDGLIVKVSANCTLYWNEMGEPANESERAQTDFFSYDEYADYTPWYIETDSLTDVKEIGLMAGDVCIGASSVEPGDTLVEVNAYTQSIPPGTSIEIATWSGFKSTVQLHDKFFVNNLNSGIKEHRKVYSGEGLPYYYLSFGKKQNTSLLSTQNHAGLISVNPNPFNNFTTVRFLVTEGSNIEITVSGINGKPIGIIVNGDYPEGVYQVTWNPGNTIGKPVENGIYIIRMSVDGIIVSNKKVVLIK